MGHLASACASLLTSTLVLAWPALAIYRLTGRFGPFHVMPPEFRGPGVWTPGRRLLRLIPLLAAAGFVTLGAAGCVGPRIYRVPTGAMAPTIKAGQSVVVMRFPPGAIRVKRGDIIVFRAPDEPDKLWIKRAVGVGGDTVELRDRQLYLNGQVVDEPYVKPRAAGLGILLGDLDDYGPVVIPEKQVCVMGDNRDNSRDSRSFGPIPLASVVGWVLF